MIGFHPFLEDHISPMVRQRICYELRQTCIKFFSVSRHRESSLNINRIQRRYQWCNIPSILHKSLSNWKTEQPRLSFQDNKPTFLSHKFTCTTLSFMSYPFLLFIHFLHLARQHWQRRQEFLCFLQESNAPQQRKNSAKAYVLSFAFSNWLMVKMLTPAFTATSF